jgi:hypothetical protein
MQILLTALATVLGGALTLALGQIIIRGLIEPALELKRLIGTIACDLDFHANKFAPGTPTESEWRDIFRKHACSLREKLNVIIWYRGLQRIFNLPSESEVQEAAYNLMGHSNRYAGPDVVPELGGREETIKKLLRIKT